MFAGTTALAAVAAVVLGLSACSAGDAAAGPGGSGNAEGRLRVVATTTQLGDFARQVGHDDISLTTLLGSGTSAHQFDPSPAHLLALSQADVLIVNGAGLEGFIDNAIEASGFHGRIITAADGIDLEEAQHITSEVAHALESADDHDHDHGDVNPHLWTSPRFAAGMVSEIARGFAAADAAHAADYESRAASYASQLDLLDEWIAAQFAGVPVNERLFVSGHDALLYYLHDYEITFVGALLPSFDDNAEPSVAEVDALIRVIKDRGVRAIFTESSINPKLAQTVAEATGVRWVSGEEALYVDALGAKGSGTDTYLGATVHNTRAILEAWGVTPASLPVELR